MAATMLLVRPYQHLEHFGALPIGRVSIMQADNDLSEESNCWIPDAQRGAKADNESKNNTLKTLHAAPYGGLADPPLVRALADGIVPIPGLI
jgi:hypothetical protein